MPPKLVLVTLIRRHDHPWNPDVIEYSVIQMLDGEPNYLHAGQSITAASPITGATTLDDVQAIAEADATSRGWLT